MNKQSNGAKIIRALEKHGDMTIAETCKHTKMTANAISGQFSQLEGMGKLFVVGSKDGVFVYSVKRPESHSLVASNGVYKGFPTIVARPGAFDYLKCKSVGIPSKERNWHLPASQRGAA